MHEVLQRIRTKLSKTKKNFVTVEEKIPPEFRLKKPPQGSSTTTKIIPKAKSKKVKVVDKGKTRAIPSTNSKNVEMTSKPTHNTKIIEKNVKRSTTHVSFSKLDEISPILLNKEVSIHIPTSSETIPSTTQPTLTSTPISRTSSKNQENKIHIISNIKLTQSIRPVAINPESSTINDTSDDFFGFNDEAKHSSTPQNKTKMNISTPWRSADLNIKRNPHWLSLKDSLLPNYNQEMIWDPELVEKPMYPKTPTRQEPTTSLVQSTILDFIGTNKNTPIKDLNQSSLFDMHTLSPLKNSNQKTRILEDKTNNCDNISLAGSEDEVENFFGFDSMEHDDNKENLRVRRIKFDLNVNKVYGPTRISLGPIKKVFFSANDKEKETPVASEGNDLNVSAKEDEQSTLNEGDEEANQIPSRPRRKGTKYRKQIDLEETEELNNSSAMNETDVGDPDSDFEGSSIAKSKSEDVPLVGLFIDLEEPRPTHQVYISKRRKRGRLLSTHSEHEKEEEEVPDEPKKKKKDVFTPAEEKEFKKWVASFNAMCDDVDKHDLEIE